MAPTTRLINRPTSEPEAIVLTRSGRTATRCLGTRSQLEGGYACFGASLQPARNHPEVGMNWAGGDPPARPMAGPEGFAPIPRWATRRAAGRHRRRFQRNAVNCMTTESLESSG